MKVKVVFDKARGLRPDQTDEFFAQYNFQGEWSVAKGKVELNQEESFEEIDKIIREYRVERENLYPKPKPSERPGEEFFKKKWPNGKKWPTQQYIADKLGISVGKCNSLMKKYDKWIEEQTDIDNVPF